MLKTILTASVVCLALASNVNAARADSDKDYIKAVKKSTNTGWLGAEEKYYASQKRILTNRIDSQETALKNVKTIKKQLKQDKKDLKKASKRLTPIVERLLLIDPSM